jgi:beta-galactosidase
VPSLALAANRDTVLNLLPLLPKQKSGKEYFLNLSFNLKSDQLWAKAGQLVASNQIALTGLPVAGKASPSGARLTLAGEGDLFRVTGKTFKLTFDQKTGALSSYVSGGKEQLASPLIPNFTRPQTDNDYHGWKTHKVLREWYDSKPQVSSFTIRVEPNGKVKAESQYAWIDGKATVLVTYTIDGRGVVRVDYALKADDRLPNIPRVGMCCGIANDYRQVSWYGLGFQENYLDRRYGCDVGIYTLPLAEFLEPYVKPQENGNRTDVRWMYLANPAHQGLLVIAGSLLSMSAWPYPAAAYQKVRHYHELEESGYVTLNIDLIQMGVGGNDSWSEVAAPLEKYQVKAKDYAYSFYLCPVKMKVEQVTKNWVTFCDF